MDMHPAILVAAGTVLLLSSLSLFRKLIPAIKWPYMKKSWRLLSYLVFLFLAADLIYLRALFLPATAYQPTNLWIGAVIFSVSVFVLATMKAAYQLASGLAETEGEVIHGRNILEYDQESVERTKKELAAKEEELEKTLEELYLLRDAMERGKAKISSRKIKKLLDDLKGTTSKPKKVR